MRTDHTILTREDADRLIAVLKRHGGACTLRDLHRRHRFWQYKINAAERAGVIQIEIRKKRTGRPSIVALLSPATVNKPPSAKLPRRQDLMQTLTYREELFCLEYYCHGGLSSSFFGIGRGGHSAADAYRRVYGRRGRLTDASARSAGARLARRPYMRAAWRYCIRVFKFGQTPGRGYWYPDDMRSDGKRWLQFICWLEREFGTEWNPVIVAAVGYAKNFPAACAAVKPFLRTDAQRSDLKIISGEWWTDFVAERNAAEARDIEENALPS